LEAMQPDHAVSSAASATKLLLECAIQKMKKLQKGGKRMFFKF